MSEGPSMGTSDDRAFIDRSIRIGIVSATLVGVFFALIFVLQGALTPLAVSLIIAYFLDPIVRWLERHGIRRRLGVLALMLIAIGLLCVVLFVILPALVGQIAELARNLPAYLDTALRWVLPRLDALGVDVPTSWTAAFDQVRASIGVERLGGWTQQLLGTVSGTLGAIVGVFVIPVIAYYMLAEFGAVKAGFVSLIPPRYRDAVVSRWQKVDHLLSGFLRGQLTVCVILGVLYAAGFAILGVPLAMLIGLISGMVAFIPYIGSALALTLAAALCVFEYGLGLRLAGVVGWYFIVQNLEGFVLTPRIVGSSVGLHPMTVIVALLIGGNLLGFLGLLVAVPVAAVVQVFVREIVAFYRTSDLYTGGSG